EVAAATELTPFATTLKEIDTVYAVPSGPIDTHGSDARSKFSPPGAHELKGSGVSPQLAPPLSEYPATRPCAPPKLNRSCCQTPTRFAGLAGLTEIQGSTSAFT